MVPRPPYLEIRLFGSPQVLVNHQPVEELRRKNRALLFYLASSRKSLQREALLSFFWPDRERMASQPILRTMIHDLRKHLGANLQGDDHSLSLSGDVRIDVQEFSFTIGSPSPELESLSNALALYQGDFLEGFSLHEPDQFDDWVISERERYKLEAIRGFTQLSRLYEKQPDPSKALEQMRRALSYNLFQEDLQREVMRLLFLNGDRTGVVRQYESLRKLLDEEMGVLPMKETRKLYDAIISDTYHPPASASIPVTSMAPIERGEFILPFLGRESELKTLISYLGRGKLILLEGEPGIGKTRIITELAAEEARKQAPLLVIRGTAYELEQGLPYQPILDALREVRSRPEWKSISAQLELEPIWWTELSRLLPEILAESPDIPAPEPTISENRLWEALLQFFKSLASRQRIWLFLNDLHWADAATIGWLGHLVRHLASPALTVIATTRPVNGTSPDLRMLLHGLKREDRLAHLHITGLPDPVVRILASRIHPGQAGDLSDWLIGNAEGNPFFLTELIRYAQDVGVLKMDGHLTAEMLKTSLVIPATIQNLIEARLLHLSENAHGVIHLGSAIGREFDLALVRRAAGLSEMALIEAMEELQEAHLVRPLEGEQWGFDHSLSMQVVLQDMSQLRRQSLHRQVARALEELHPDNLDAFSGVLAHHYLEGNLPDQAATHAFRAGQQAAALAAWVEAIAFYDQAWKLTPDAAKKARISLAMGTARFHKGDFDAASREYRTAVDLAQQMQDWPLLEAAHLALNQSYMPQARFKEAIDLAMELRRLGPPELAKTAEFCWGTALGIESAHPMEAEVHLREAERMVRETSGEPTLLSLAQIHYQLAGVVGQLGRSQEAIDLYQGVLEQIEGGKATLDILRNIMLFNNLAYHLHLLGDPRAARYIEAGIRLAHKKGSLTHLPFLYSTSGEIALDENRPEEADKFFQDGLDIARQIPMPERVAGMTANLGLAAFRRGEPALAVQRLNEALDLARQVGSRHLEVRIRIWLIPLLSASERGICLNTARTIAEEEGLKALLEEIRGLEKIMISTGNP